MYGYLVNPELKSITEVQGAESFSEQFILNLLGCDSLQSEAGQAEGDLFLTANNPGQSSAFRVGSWTIVGKALCVRATKEELMPPSIPLHELQKRIAWEANPGDKQPAILRITAGIKKTDQRKSFQEADLLELTSSLTN